MTKLNSKLIGTIVYIYGYVKDDHKFRSLIPRQLSKQFYIKNDRTLVIHIPISEYTRKYRKKNKNFNTEHELDLRKTKKFPPHTDRHTNNNQ